MLVVLVFSTMLYSNLHCVFFTFFFLFFSMEVSSLLILPSFSCFLYRSHTFSSSLLFFLPTTFLFKLRLLKIFLETPKLSRN